jgi:outer membrane lipoprotein-sorting protein
MMLLSLIIAVATAAPAEDDFFTDFEAKRDHIVRLQARFSQETVTPDEATLAVGIIVYEKPRRILLQYQDPAVTYLIDETRVYQYDVDLEQVQIYDLDDDPQLAALFLGFDSDTGRLREAYGVELFDPEPDECGSQGLRLTPKPAQAGAGEDSAPMFQQIGLHLRDGDYLPCRIHVVNDADSEVEISVSDFQVNDSAGDAAATIELPEGTQIIENELLVETLGPGGKRIPDTGDGQEEPAR